MKKQHVEQEIKSAFRVAKTNKLIEAACLIALGLVLLIWSGTALTVICQVIAAIIALVGLVVIIAFFFGRSRVYGSSIGLFGGVVGLVMGLYLFFNPGILGSLGPTIIGLIVLVTGLVDLSESIRIVRQKSGGVAPALVIAVVEIVLGVVFIIHPIAINKILMKLMAVVLIADGIADIWVMFQIGKAEKPAEAIAAAAQGDFVDAEVRPMEPKPAKESTFAKESTPVKEGASQQDGYTTISHRRQETADASENGVEQDARAAGVTANQEPFGEAASETASEKEEDGEPSV